MENIKIKNEKISTTAELAALYRTYSDIPYSKEIFDSLVKIRIKDSEYHIPNELKKIERALLVEARYKIDSLLISNSNIKQILEIASGFSPMGLNMSRDTNIKYVELDFDKVVKTKKGIINNLIKENQNNNLFLEPGNALDKNDLLKASNRFNTKEPIIVINEGLLFYLNHEEKVILSKNIHELLNTFGGVWITSDILLPDSKNTDEEETYLQNLGKLANSNINQNKFKNEEEAESFFESMGFVIESHSFKEIYDQLISPKKINLNQNTIDNLIGSSVAFVMKIKNQQS